MAGQTPAVGCADVARDCVCADEGATPATWNEDNYLNCYGRRSFGRNIGFTSNGARGPFPWYCFLRLSYLLGFYGSSGLPVMSVANSTWAPPQRRRPLPLIG